MEARICGTLQTSTKQEGTSSFLTLFHHFRRLPSIPDIADLVNLHSSLL
jgi:hypothetical protein